MATKKAPQPNTFNSLQADCKAKGTTLYKVCLSSGIDYRAVKRWSAAEPKTLKTLAEIRNQIDSIK
jgi:hypothetical protein